MGDTRIPVYLQAGYRPEDATISQLMSFLSAEGVTLPVTRKKKDVYLALFHEHITPRVPALIETKLSVVPSTEGITLVGPVKSSDTFQVAPPLSGTERRAPLRVVQPASLSGNKPTRKPAQVIDLGSSDEEGDEVMTKAHRQPSSQPLFPLSQRERPTVSLDSPRTPILPRISTQPPMRASIDSPRALTPSRLPVRASPAGTPQSVITCSTPITRPLGIPLSPPPPFHVSPAHVSPAESPSHYSSALDRSSVVPDVHDSSMELKALESLAQDVMSSPPSPVPFASQEHMLNVTFDDYDESFYNEIPLDDLIPDDMQVLSPSFHQVPTQDIDEELPPFVYESDVEGIDEPIGSESTSHQDEPEFTTLAPMSSGPLPTSTSFNSRIFDDAASRVDSGHAVDDRSSHYKRSHRSLSSGRSLSPRRHYASVRDHRSWWMILAVGSSLVGIILWRLVTSLQYCPSSSLCVPCPSNALCSGRQVVGCKDDYTLQSSWLASIVPLWIFFLTQPKCVPLWGTSSTTLTFKLAQVLSRMGHLLGGQVRLMVGPVTSQRVGLAWSLISRLAEQYGKSVFWTGVSLWMGWQLILFAVSRHVQQVSSRGVAQSIFPTLTEDGLVVDARLVSKLARVDPKAAETLVRRVEGHLLAMGACQEEDTGLWFPSDADASFLSDASLY